MCQYALLVAVSARTGFEFGIPFSNYTRGKWNGAVEQYCCLPDCFPHLSVMDSTGQPAGPQFQERAWWLVDDNVFKVADGSNFHGYFQAAGYFTPHRDRLLREFAPNQFYAKRALQHLATLDKLPVVFVHVRRTDALRNPHIITPDAWYFNTAAATFAECQFVVVSDDYDWCREYLTMEPHTESPFTDKFDDFELMRYCDHGIIANSTYSWWPAWLGTNQDRRIIAPLPWVDASKDSMIPAGWTQLPAIENFIS